MAYINVSNLNQICRHYVVPIKKIHICLENVCSKKFCNQIIKKMNLGWIWYSIITEFHIFWMGFNSHFMLWVIMGLHFEAMPCVTFKMTTTTSIKYRMTAPSNLKYHSTTIATTLVITTCLFQSYSISPSNFIHSFTRYSSLETNSFSKC